MINSNDKRILVLRYGTNIVHDCIEKHIELVLDLGFCWFAKLGRTPSKKILDDIFVDGKAIIILYSRQGAYVCESTEYGMLRPDNGEPDYYVEKIYGAQLKPSIYFKLISIKKLEGQTLSQLVVSSSGNMLSDTLSRSMNSFFVVETEAYRKRNRDKNNAEKKKDKKPIFNDCVHRKDGKCDLKGFINYKYECDRPSSCIRQKN